MNINISYRTKIERIFFILGIVYFLGQFLFCWNQPILDQYAFRQTQTAISSYWIIHGGNWLAYPTPVLGAPWAIPFEFPLYQWLAAGLAATMHFLTLDQSGRLVSAAFFLGCLWPAWRITKHFSDGSSIFRIAASLVLFSPLYAFWSRSFMMESAVLFFSGWFVAALFDYLNEPSGYGFIEMCGTGSVAACIKITTFFGFSVAGAFILLYMFAINIRSMNKFRQVYPYLLTGVAVLFSIATLETWVIFSDNVKSRNILASMYTSSALAGWNFGSLAQRWSIALLQVIWVRAPNEALGSWIIAALAAIGVIFLRGWQKRMIFAALVFLYLITFYTFTNLHLVHHYYQYANSIFLVVAVAYVIFSIAQSRSALILPMMCVVVFAEIYGYSQYFYDDLVGPNRVEQQLISNYLRENTPSQDMFVGFGLTWSSEVPYYAERRAMLISGNTSADKLSYVRAHIAELSGGYPISSVVTCPDSQSAPKPKEYNQLITQLITNRKPNYVGYCIVYH